MEEIVDELVSISQEIREQLKFFKQLGLEDVGGAASAGDGAPRAISKEAALPAQDSLTSRASVLASTTAPEQNVDLFGEVISSSEQKRSRSAKSSMPLTVVSDESLESIRDDIGDCHRCRLHEQRKTIVFGEGNPRAKLVFVGEGPGAEEDLTGRPFVGRAGQLLDKIIAAIGLAREDVYIANIVKCRPPGNRTPERDEVETCEPFLFRQLASIKPRVIVALGSPAFQCLLRTREPITRARGEWRELNGIKVMPTFHPAFLLRSPDKKREVWEDMKKVRDFLNQE